MIIYEPIRREYKAPPKEIIEIFSKYKDIILSIGEEKKLEKIDLKAYMYVIPNIIKLAAIIIMGIITLSVFVICCPFICFKFAQNIINFFANILQEVFEF